MLQVNTVSLTYREKILIYIYYNIYQLFFYESIFQRTGLRVDWFSGNVQLENESEEPPSVGSDPRVLPETWKVQDTEWSLYPDGRDSDRVLVRERGYLLE